MFKSCALASLEHLRNKEAPRSKSHQVAIQGFKPPKTAHVAHILHIVDSLDPRQPTIQCS